MEKPRMISRRDTLAGGLLLGALGLVRRNPAQAEGVFASYSEAALAKAMKSGRPVLVHIHADW